VSTSHIVFTGLASKLLHRDQDGCIFVLKQEYKEFGWGCLACIVTNGVNIVGPFIKHLPGSHGYGLIVVHGHDDAAFQHIDKAVRVMPMDGGRGYPEDIRR